MRFFPTLMMCALVSAPAAAQEVRQCDELASAQAIAEPWDENTRTFANDRVRLAIIDTLEPAAAAFHLMILSPPYDELGSRQCRLVGLGNKLGFAGLSLDGLSSSYDPAKGLTWELPATVYDAATGGFQQAPLSVTIDQSSGEITAGLP